jgi:hypothetical protein
MLVILTRPASDETGDRAWSPSIHRPA